MRADMGLCHLFLVHPNAQRQSFVHSPHLLAPTASDLVKYSAKDTILAGFHTDLNFLTIHGRSRYPGLNIWARNTGKRIPVRFPPTGRYLLVQAGKQLEHHTGGLIKAGYHEVVVNDATLEVNTLFLSPLSLYDFHCRAGCAKSKTAVSKPASYSHLLYVLLALVFGPLARTSCFPSGARSWFPGGGHRRGGAGCVRTYESRSTSTKVRQHFSTHAAFSPDP